MMSRGQKTAMFLGLVLGFTAALVLGAVLFGRSGQTWAALGWVVIWGIAIAITLGGLIGFRRETDPRLSEGGAFVVVEPPTAPLPPATDRKNPWPAQWLAPALATAFEGTPYVVRSDGHSILVHADLVDTRWQHVATLHRLRHTFLARFTPTDKPGVIRRTDETRKLEGSAGVTHLGAQTSVASGRQWGYTRRIEYGLGLDGFKKRVDYEFSTGEINEPVGEIMKRAGWRPTLDAESKGALIIGGFGLSAVVVVPLAFLIRWLIS